MAISTEPSVRWITAPDQIATASQESLMRTILTADGAGTAVKAPILCEIVERAIKEHAEHNNG